MSHIKLLPPKGFKAGGIHCGIKRHKKDLALVYSEVPATAAGVFTTNYVQAAPVKLTKNAITNGSIQAIIINSGNANAVTGKQGDHDALEMARATANALCIDITKVAVASTGSIGKPLPTKSVIEGIEKLSPKIKPSSFLDAAEAIRTTDTTTKGISRKTTLDNKEITITAIAKGAGMIHPNMATMLCFICTDLAINKKLLHQVLTNSVNKSFNRITVDGCTSTNDMVLALANGEAKNQLIEKPCDQLDKVQKEFDYVTQSLAKMIVKDGEGATKLVQIKVTGANTKDDAKAIAFNIANSPLLKSSFYGETLNWGRIISAAGSSGIKIDPECINIYLEDILLLSCGQPVQFSATDIEHILKQEEIHFKIELNQGKAQSSVWTCDLSPKYIKINM